ncbi:phosphatase PAP2 family protein [Micromonospora echinofusca]|uniref:Phosphatase PAP2 family protein n=1 Tax=Micromonospora echinofusca TaxID=47858 RepID=A0ABS3VY89_MICEH|nr:phosphatase PAP2 family protein [Micromonospora echinofusca]MBO4209492.1 phosphatase PAP2 family protein [Micromonospora echinofusca]
MGPDAVTEVSADWYREIVGFAADSPPAVQWFAAHFTEASIILLGLLLAGAAVRHLGAPTPGRALALAAPLGVLLAYGLSEGVKVLLDQERPCRTFSQLETIARCPPTGDWSFPSNHSTIAGATAAAVLLLSRQLGVIAAVIAVLAAFSRTFVGVHYPHDVLVGLLLGATVAGSTVPLLARWVTGPVSRRIGPLPGRLRTGTRDLVR